VILEWLFTTVFCNCLQAVVDGVEPVTQCIHFHGAVYDPETFTVTERVNKEAGMVS